MRVGCFLYYCKPAVSNHAALPGQLHLTRLVHVPQLHVSSSAGWTIQWPPAEVWQKTLSKL